MDSFGSPSMAVTLWLTNFFFGLSMFSCRVLQTFVLTDTFLQKTARTSTWAELGHTGSIWGRLFPEMYYQPGTGWLMPIILIEKGHFSYKDHNHQEGKLSACHFVLSEPIKTSSAFCCPRGALLFSKQQSNVQTQVSFVRKKETWFECNGLWFFFLESFNPWKD